MLTKKEIIKEAITWQALALYFQSQGYKPIQAFSIANTYIDVLQLPNSRQCGENSQQHLVDYANNLIEVYIKEGYTNIDDYLDKNINTKQWE